jgi:hypothetical protein
MFLGEKFCFRFQMTQILIFFIVDKMSRFETHLLKETKVNDVFSA